MPTEGEPPNEPGTGAPPDEPGTDLPLEEPGTVSGLREANIAGEDLGELQAACRLHKLPTGMSAEVRELDGELIAPGLPRDKLNRIPESALPSPRTLRMRIAFLPRKAQLHHLALPSSRVRVHRDLPLALSQSIRRPRLLAADLSDAQHSAVKRLLHEKYGEQARGMRITAVFAEVPPEAQELSVAPDLRYLQFSWPADVAPKAAKAGWYCVLLADAGGQTKRLLLRL